MLAIRTLLSIAVYLIALIPYIPLARHVEYAPRILLPLCLLAGVLLERTRRPVGSRWLTVATIVSFVYYVLKVTRIDPVTPLVNLLLMLLAIRLLGEKTPRIILQVFALALLSLATSSLYELGPLFFVCFISLVLLIAAALLLLTFVEQDPLISLRGRSLRVLVLTALLLPAAAIPVSLMLFPLLPRTQFPLWAIVPAGKGSAAGIAESVRPGAYDRVAENTAPAFRAAMKPLPADRLYWRVTVFNVYDGVSWKREAVPLREKAVLGDRFPVTQTLYVSGLRGRLLPTLDYPQKVTGVRVSGSTDGVQTLAGVQRGNLRYDVESAQLYRTLSPGGEWSDYYRRLPAVLSPRLAEEAEKLAASGLSGRDMIAKVEDFFRSRTLRYGTEGLAGGSDPLDTFLFNGGAGNCEYFASSFALFLRSCNIPCRLVGGYFGGDYNELGGYYLVRESHAHVWVEAYIAGEGWLRLDPTRLSGGFARQRSREQASFAYRARLLSDTVSYYWTQTVVNYDLEQQMTVIHRVGSSMRGLPPLRNLVRSGLIFLLLGGTAFLLWKLFRMRGGAGLNAWLIRLFSTAVKRAYGIEMHAAVGLNDVARQTGDSAAGRFAELYGSRLYRDQELSRAEYKELFSLVKRIGREGASAPGRLRESPVEVDCADSDSNDGKGGEQD